MTRSLRVLVVGGTGFIGPWAVRALVARGHEVTVVHRGETEADLPDGVVHVHHPGPFTGGRACFADLEAEFRAWQPDVVLDMVCSTAADGWALATTFCGVARRAVVVSSVDVYQAYAVLTGREPGPVDPAPLAEGAPLRRSLHPFRSDEPWTAEDGRPAGDDYDKLLAERMATAFPELPVTAARLPMVHGPGSYRYYGYVRRMQDSRPAVLLDERMCAWRASRAYVENVGDALAALVEHDRSTAVNVGDGTAPDELEWVERIAAEVGWDGRIVAVPSERLPVDLRRDLAWDQPLIVDDGLLRAATGFEPPVDACTGLARTVAWQLATPPDDVSDLGLDYDAEDAVLAALEDEPVREGTAS